MNPEGLALTAHFPFCYVGTVPVTQQNGRENLAEFPKGKASSKYHGSRFFTSVTSKKHEARVQNTLCREGRLVSLAASHDSSVLLQVT